MKRNKKTLSFTGRLIVLLVVIATLASVFSACGNTKAPATTPTTASTATTTAPTAPTASPEDAAKAALASYLTQKHGHTAGTFLYTAGNRALVLTKDAITGEYASINEAKSAIFGSDAGKYRTKEVAAGLLLLVNGEDPYFRAVPKSQGVQNVIDRAYQLTDIEWTTVAGMPGVAKIDGEFTVITYEPGVTYKGIPYSGTTSTDTYVGMNVSLETFLTALKNKNSVLYTENLFSTNNKAATYYGTVCSKFAQYALDITGSYNSQNMHNIPGVATIAVAGNYTVDQIQIGDIVVNPTVHTTICTGILYDEDGNIAFVEISEAVLPRLRRLLWTPEEFYKHFASYMLCRYQNIDNVPAAPDTLSGEETYALMPRYGDKYNYKVSKTAGVVDILEKGYSKAVVLRDGAIISQIPLDDTTETFQFDRSVPGYIEMYLEKADGTRSGSVYACVVKSSVKTIDYSEFASGKITVSFEGSSGTPLYIEINQKQNKFCDIRYSQDGQATITFSTSGLSLSTASIRVAFQNEYGIYLSARSKIKSS